MTDLDPDGKNKNAMNEINAQRRLREAANEKAEAEKKEREEKEKEALVQKEEREAFRKQIREERATFFNKLEKKLPGGKRGNGYSLNFPLQAGMDDASYSSIFKPVVTKVMATFQPGAVVLCCGADSLSGDRVGCWNLSIRGHAACLEHGLASRVLDQRILDDEFERTALLAVDVANL